MAMQNISKGLKILGKAISENSPQICTCLGCAGVLATAAFTGKASVQAYEAILQAEEIDFSSQAKYYEPLSKQEIVKLTWKYFIPPVIMGGASIACIIGANAINARRNAALAALYSLSETALREYKDKVLEEVGKNKALKLRQDLAQDKITANPVGDRTIIITGNGDVLCYDVLCDRYFKSSPEKIRQQVLDLNYTLMDEMWVDLNDFYYAIGLPNAKLGNEMGFDIDKGKIVVDFSSQLTPDGQPCLVVDVPVYPKHNR